MIVPDVFVPMVILKTPLGASSTVTSVAEVKNTWTARAVGSEPSVEVCSLLKPKVNGWPNDAGLGVAMKAVYAVNTMKNE